MILGGIFKFYQVFIKSSERVYTIGDFRWVFPMYISFWRGFVTFISFSPRSGLCTIREKAGTSSWILVKLVSRPPSIVSFLFPKMRDERTYVREKNQTSKVSLCCKRTGSKNSLATLATYIQRHVFFYGFYFDRKSP